MDALAWHRFQFGFTITYHYLFPQLTMGLALLIVATNAFMQHPTGYAVGPNGGLQLSNFGAYLFNPWAIWQYLHTMCAAVVTGSFVVAAVGAYWTLMNIHAEHSRIFLKVGVV